ncbi:hypothetical protein SCYAM73S_08403 [Streptomyces cyaneofuscatus]
MRLDQVPAHCDKIVFPVSIHDADNRGQAFGQVSNAFIRVVNQADGQELARYDLSEDASTETAMIFGELYRYQGDGNSVQSVRGTRRGSGHRSLLRRQRFVTPRTARGSPVHTGGDPYIDTMG